MDFNVNAVNRIVTAINKVNTSIQKTSVYVTQNTYALGTASVVEVSGVSSIEGGLGLVGIILMRGLIAGISNVSGFVNHHLFSGGITGASDTISNLDVSTGIRGNSISTSSGITSTLKSIMGMMGSCSAGSNVFAINLQ